MTMINCVTVRWRPSFPGMYIFVSIVVYGLYVYGRFMHMSQLVE